LVNVVISNKNLQNNSYTKAYEVRSRAILAALKRSVFAALADFSSFRIVLAAMSVRDFCDSIRVATGLNSVSFVNSVIIAFYSQSEQIKLDNLALLFEQPPALLFRTLESLDHSPDKAGRARLLFVDEICVSGAMPNFLTVVIKLNAFTDGVCIPPPC